MSVGPLAGPIAASAAGSHLAQTKGTDTDRARHEAMSQQRTTESQLKAEAAAGIGATDGENHESNERDADGRLPWQRKLRRRREEDEAKPPKDPSGQSGSLLDLSG